MGVFQRAMFVAAVLGMAGAAPGQADEISRRQEAIRAPLRAAYVQAKRAELDSIARRQTIVDRMAAALVAGTQQLERIRKTRVEIANTLVARRDERRLAKQAHDVALGRAGGNAFDPAVRAAQAKLEALDAEIAALVRNLATYEQAERDKVSIPNGDAQFAAYLSASLDLDKAHNAAIRAFAAYVVTLSPEPPPYLQSVQVYAGTRAIYRAEWRIDGKAADLATRELGAALDKIVVDNNRAWQEMQELREYFRQQRLLLIEPLKKYSEEIRQAAEDIDYNGVMVVLLPALIEAAGVVIEVAVSGGASTVERHVVEEGVKAGTAVASALSKKAAGKALSEAEQASVKGLVKTGISDTEWTLIQTYLAKKLPDAALGWKAEDQDQATSWRPSDLIDGNLAAGSSDATKVLLADGAEQLLARVAKVGVATISYKGVAGLAAASAENLTAWQAVRSGAVNFYGAKTPVENLKGAFKGERAGNILGLCITAAKTVAAAYYGVQLGAAEQRFVEANSRFDFAYHWYYVVLNVDRILVDKMNDMQSRRLQALAYGLMSAGPRSLAVLTNEGNSDPTETLSFMLHFSRPLDQPPQVRIAGLVLDMKPQGAADRGGWAHWEGQLPARKLPDSLNEGVLEVSLPDGSKPYAALDSNPASPARFVVPEALDQPLPDREEWTDYERGPDRNHRIAFHPSRPQTVPWRGASSCDKIDCDCGVIPIGPGVVGDADRKICLSIEDALRRDCRARQQTFGACPPNAGPAAYPPPQR